MTVLRTQWKALAIVLFLPYLQFLGCTIIGGLIGRGIDDSKPDYEAYPKIQLITTKAGTEISLVRRDTTVIEGEFLGIMKRSNEQYILVYNDAINRSTYTGYIPNLGEPASIRTSKLSREGIFLGIDADQVLMQFQQEEPTRIRLDSVEEIKGSEGQLLPGADLRELSYSGNIPGLTYIAMSVEGQDVSVSYESVKTLRVPTSKHAATIGFGIGLVADVVVVVLFINAMDDLEESNCGLPKKS